MPEFQPLLFTDKNSASDLLQSFSLNLDSCKTSIKSCNAFPVIGVLVGYPLIANQGLTEKPWKTEYNMSHIFQSPHIPKTLLCFKPQLLHVNSWQSISSENVNYTRDLQDRASPTDIASFKQYDSQTSITCELYKDAYLSICHTFFSLELY